MNAPQANGSSPPPEGVEVLTPAEVARLYRVDPKTVTRWADKSKVTSFRTPGGHRRFRADEIFALLAGTVQHREGQQ